MLIPLFVSFVALVCGAPPCRFAELFTADELLSSAEVRERYKYFVAYWENGFHQPGVGYSAASGYTFDGHGLDYTTGATATPLHNFSAPSKEAMHVGMLALAVNGSTVAQTFVDPTGSKNAIKLAVQLLRKKIDAYEAWNQKYPGYGGFMPWVSVSNDLPTLDPTPDWLGRVPGLDNGEWAWALYSASITLSSCKECGSLEPNLASRYRAYFDLMAQNSVMMFYEGSGLVRAETRIRDVFHPPFPANYENAAKNYFLDDPYEGELFVMFMDLYGNWSSSAEREKVWAVKKLKLIPVNYALKHDPTKKITVQQGFWFSTHEQWKYLELPYLDVPIHERLFKNCERARVVYSWEREIPGLYASVSNWTSSGPVAQYFGAVGIPEIAINPSITRDLLTPYGSMMLMLTEPPIGLAWHHNMLLMPRMQGIHGTTESMSADGQYIAPVVTWDSKITTLLAMSGGLGPINRIGLEMDGRYKRFVHILTENWSVFQHLEGEDVPFPLPPKAHRPPGVPDFTLCKDSTVQTQ